MGTAIKKAKQQNICVLSTAKGSKKKKHVLTLSLKLYLKTVELIMLLVINNYKGNKILIIAFIEDGKRV